MKTLKLKSWPVTIFLTVFAILGVAGGILLAANFSNNNKTIKAENTSENLTVQNNTEEVSTPSTSQPTPTQEKTTENKTETTSEKKEEPKKEVKKEEPKPAPIIEPSPPSYSKPFAWGVAMRPNAIGNYNSTNWQTQIDKAKELGIGWARIDWERDGNSPVARNTGIIDALRAKGIGVILVIDKSFNGSSSNWYQDGYNDGKSISSAVASKVDFYQLANEGGATSIKSGTLSGVSKSDYNEDKYQKVKEYIRGLSAGIDAGDSGATKIVTISWTHTGFLDKLADDHVKYDMIGIDWYSWMGSFGAKKINDSQTLYSKLKSYGKPLSFMEVALLPQADPNDSKKKTVVDEGKQKDFVTSHGQWAWDHRDWFKVFCVYELVDNINNPTEYVDYYGLVKASFNSTGTGVLGAAREAFGAYKNLIAGHK